MNSDISPQLADLLTSWMTGNWYECEAYRAVMRGWFREIRGEDGSLYLLRCWMVQPKPEPDSSEKFESADSVLLHYFPRPDHDRCFHDHPWSFTTTILAGGYIEAVPGDTWRGKAQGLGPDAVGDSVHVKRSPGDTVERAATDLHLVRSLLHHHCWTLVRTGARTREWGFHPAGQPWVVSNGYIHQRDTKQVA